MPGIPANSNNPYNVQLSKRYDPNVLGQGSSMSYNGLSIVYNNKIVGRIKSWNPSSYSREGTYIYELNMFTWGRPVDYIPGKMGEPSISFSRTEVWHEEIERVLGFGGVWVDLMDQNIPFTIFEYLFKGNIPYRVWKYHGCWFKSKEYGEYSGDGNAVVEISGEIAYIRKESLVQQ